jgi:hypothetical protein
MLAASLSAFGPIRDIERSARRTVARKLERYCSRWRRTELLGVTQLCLRARITPRVRHAARRRGGDVAACGARADSLLDQTWEVVEHPQGEPRRKKLCRPLAT